MHLATIFAVAPDLVAARLGSLLLTFAHGRAHWHALDGMGPWWRVPIGRA